MGCSIALTVCSAPEPSVEQRSRIGVGAQLTLTPMGLSAGDWLICVNGSRERSLSNCTNAALENWRGGLVSGAFPCVRVIPRPMPRHRRRIKKLRRSGSRRDPRSEPRPSH